VVVVGNTAARLTKHDDEGTRTLAVWPLQALLDFLDTLLDIPSVRLTHVDLDHRIHYVPN
jgi:hypothetical protein